MLLLLLSFLNVVYLPLRFRNERVKHGVDYIAVFNKQRAGNAVELNTLNSIAIPQDIVLLLQLA
jgi:ribosomal protein L7Ae-like RNA K-turn-binding protein